MAPRVASITVLELSIENVNTLIPFCHIARRKFGCPPLGVPHIAWIFSRL